MAEFHSFNLVILGAILHILTNMLFSYDIRGLCGVPTLYREVDVYLPADLVFGLVLCKKI
jgi:hypothetical protein